MVDVPGLLHLHRHLMLWVLGQVVLLRRGVRKELLLLLLGRLRRLRLRVRCSHRLSLRDIGLLITGRWLIRTISWLSGGWRMGLRRRRGVVVLRLLLLRLAPVIILSPVAIVGIKSALLGGRARRLGRCPLLIKGAYCRRLLLNMGLLLLGGGSPVCRVIGLVWLRRWGPRRQRRLV